VTIFNLAFAFFFSTNKQSQQSFRQTVKMGREKVFAGVGVLVVVGACFRTVVMKQARAPAELFAHGGATDFVGRKPRASAFHSFHAHTFPTGGAQKVNSAVDMVGRSGADLRLQSLSELNNHNMVIMHSELSKCFHLAKSFQGTKSGQRKVTAAQKAGAKRCLHLAQQQSKDSGHSQVKGKSQKHEKTTMPAFLRKAAWDEQAADAHEINGLTTVQVQAGVQEWEALGAAHGQNS